MKPGNPQLVPHPAFSGAVGTSHVGISLHASEKGTANKKRGSLDDLRNFLLYEKTNVTIQLKTGPYITLPKLR